MRSLFRWTLVVSVLLVSAAAWLLATPAGLRFALDRLQAHSDGRLEIAHADGRLWDAWSVSGLTARSATGEVHIEHADLRWRPLPLTRGRLIVRALRLRGVTVTLHDAPAAAAPAQEDAEGWGGLPIGFDIELARVDGLEIRRAAAEPIVLAEVELRASSRGDTVTLERALARADAWSFDARGRIDAAAGPALDLHTDWQWILPSGELITGGGTLQGTPNRLRIEQRSAGALRSVAAIGFEKDTVTIDRLTVQDANGEPVLELAGRVETGGDAPVIDLRADWTGVGWDLEDGGRIESERGGLSVQGTLDDYRAEGSFALAAPNLPRAQCDLQAHGDRDGARIETAHLRFRHGSVQAAGAVTWSPQLEWNLTAQGSGLNPAMVWTDWPGAIAFALTSHGRRTDSGLQATVDLDELEGTLRGRPVRGRGTVATDSGGWRITGLTLASNDARVELDGRLGESWDLRFAADVPDLQAWRDDARGAVRARGRLGGNAEARVIEAHVEAQSLRTAAASARSVRGDLKLDEADAHAIELAVQADAVQFGTRTFSALQLDAHGPLRDHTFTARLNGDGVDVRWQGSGRWERPKWRATIAEATFQTAAYGTWRLQAPARVTAGAGAFQWERACWQSETGAVCARVDHSFGGVTRGDTEWRAVPLALLGAWLPADTTLDGPTRGTLRWSRTQDGTVSGRCDLTAEAAVLRYPLATEETAEIPIERIAVQATADAGATEATVSLRLPEAGHAQARVRVVGPLQLPLPRARAIEGRIDAELSELGWLPVVVPELRDSRGTLHVQASLTGTTGAPKLSGSMRLQDGAVSLIRPGIRLEPLELEARSTGDERVVFEATARSGPGTVRIEGETRLDAAHGWPTRLTIRGERFEAVRTPVAWILASPDLTARIERRAVTLEGVLEIPEATLEPRDLSGAVQPSSDVVILSAAPQEATPEPWSLRARVRVKLGDQVRFKGYGLKGRITGEVLAIDEPDKPTLGQGELRIADGTYKALGLQLDIDRGRLVFASGPIDDPGVDAQAVRRSGDVLAGLRVQGRLRNPQISLFSVPAMPDSDVLSYLLFGRRMQAASTEEGEQLNRTAAALGLTGGEFLAKKLGKPLGLDEVRVESGDTPEDASFNVGKYLTPRLYVGYGIGLFDSLSTFRMRYQINRWFSIETESGVNTGGDLLFSIEK